MVRETRQAQFALSRYLSTSASDAQPRVINPTGEGKYHNSTTCVSHAIYLTDIQNISGLHTPPHV